MEDKQIITALTEPLQLGDIFMQSGMFADIKSQAQAVVKILAGKELGLAPLESMTNIFIVNGKVALQAKVIGSLIKRSKKYDYSVKKIDDLECSVVFYEIDGKGQKSTIGESVFTFKDSAKAGLVNKDVWKNYPRNMLFARALSNGARWFCPEVFCGYTPDEIEESPKAQEVITINQHGEVVKDVAPEVAPPVSE